MSKWVCVQKCPELDFDNSSHCKTDDIYSWNERYTDGCPVGNYPIWEKSDDQPPYSEKDYQEAKAQGLDLDDWNDYVKFYHLGEEEEFE